MPFEDEMEEAAGFDLGPDLLLRFEEGRAC